MLLSFGDPYGTRTHDTTVKGWCLNRLTKGPCMTDKSVFFIMTVLTHSVILSAQAVFIVVAAVRFEPTTCRV